MRIMAITSVGTEIFKTLSNGMRVSTRTEGNKVFTKLFDKEGKVLIDRTKSFEKSVVGNKKVVTKKEDKIVNLYNKNDSFGFRYQADRVYDKNGELVGMREIENKPGSVKISSGKNPLDFLPTIKHITKSVSTSQRVFSYMPFSYLESPVAKSYVKDFANGKVIRKFATELVDGLKYKLKSLPVGCRKPQYNNTIHRQSAIIGSAKTGEDLYKVEPFLRAERSIRYNKKGLPLPESIGLQEFYKMENMSLSDMKSLFKSQNGNTSYYLTDLNMFE